jgi:hypothetical protein
MKRLLISLAAAALFLVGAQIAYAIETCGPEGCDPTTEPAKRPDLRATGSAVRAPGGAHWAVTVVVTNGGVGPAGSFDVVVRNGTAVERSFPVAGLAPGQTAAFTYQRPLPANPGATCSLSLMATADPGNHVLEFTKGNNTAHVEATLAPCALDSDTVDEICADRFEVSPGGVIPVCSTTPLKLGNPTATRAIVVINGQERDAPTYLRTVRDSASAAGAGDVLVIAPQFLTEDDVGAWGLGKSALFWSDSGWKQGDRSQSTPAHPRSVIASSFAAVDAILQRLTSRSAFPSLRTVVVTGHSAGGQFTNRFAAGSPAEAWLRASGITTVRYAVANPSSYLYMTPSRPRTVAASCRPNDYRYGLAALNEYMAGVGAATIRARYGLRQVTYLLGANDNDPLAARLDMSCRAQAQGANRLERGQLYLDSLAPVYGAGVYARHRERVVPGVGHSSIGIYNSAAGREALFAP